MIYPETNLYAADNGGGRHFKCIKIIKKKSGKAGDSIIVTVKKARPRKKIKKGKVYRGVIVQTKGWHTRPFGNKVAFLSNRVVILKRGENIPIGSRISRFVFFELRKRGYMKIVTLSPGQI
jgi:large subunit ribosomal protein L14